MPVTKLINAKATVKQFTNNDLPIQGLNAVIASYYATSTSSQTVINLPFSIYASGVNANTDIFWLFVDGKKLNLGASNDYTFTSVAADGSSSQVTLNQSLFINLNIQAFKLGLKKEVEYQTDNRFVALYEYIQDGFQGFVNPLETLIIATTTTGTPAAGTFYSAILGRASMIDLSQDLKSRMGVERTQIQQIYPLQNEFGASGEIVWATPNDLFGQIRLVGSWGVDYGLDGNRIFSGSNTTDFIEVTFYGTGFNLLGTRSDNRNIAWKVDGGSETLVSNFWGTSAVIGQRNFAQNVVGNITSGLTLGIHTVTVRANASNALQISGFEVLNESSSVKTAPGIGYIQGKRLVSSALDSFSYSAPVTGTRGGRTLIYQASDGSIGKAFQATNASSATLTSADHTNEEIIKTHSPREFGAGRADDFSLAAASGSYAFTLDDGTTTLVGSNVSEGIFSNTQLMSLAANGAFACITFVGTGLDIVQEDSASGGADSYNIQIDGGSTISLSGTGSTNARLVKIVSGLPYGTHVIRFNRVTAATWILGIRKLITYGPKKPTLPSGALELGEYYVMADFVANTVVGLDTMATGVLRKFNTREFAYTEGTGGTQVWTTSFNVSTNIGGFDIIGDHTNAFVEYTFFGTGFEFRTTARSDNSANITVFLNGTLATTANFGTMVTSVYGTGVVYTAGTAVLDIKDASTQSGVGFRLSGLPLAKYTVKFNQNTASAGSDFLRFGVLDIITPIHSVKSNLYADQQNTLPVGSNAISDNRKLTPVKDALPAVKAWAQAQGVTASPTTTSTAPVPCPDLSLTVKTNGGDLAISYSMGTYITGGAVGNGMYSRIYVDGVAVGPTVEVDNPNTTAAVVNHSSSIRVPAAPGVHKVDIFWWTQTGTVSGVGATKVLTVREL